MPNLDDIEGGRIRLNNVDYDLDEIAYGPSLEVIWPLSMTYAIVTSSIVIHYSEDKNGNAATMITADGYNYAYATANIQVFRNGVLYQTLQNQRLTPVTLTKYGSTDPSPDFYIATVNGQYVIRGYHLHTTNKGNPTSCVVEWGFGSAPTVTPTTNVIQEANLENIGFWTESIFASWDGNSVITSLDMTSAGQSNVPIYIYSNGKWRGNYTSGDPYPTRSDTILLSGPGTGDTRYISASVWSPTHSPSAVLDNFGQYFAVSFPANTSTTEYNSYEILISYMNLPTELTATVHEDSSTYSYNNLSVSEYYYIDGNGNHTNVIPAGGGSLTPYVVFSLDYRRNGVLQATMTGTANTGEVYATASDQWGVYTTEVTLEYGGTGMDVAGVVSAISKGANPSGQTTVASGLKVRIKKGAATSTYRNASDGRMVLQQANSSIVKTPGSFNVTSLYFETSPANLTSCKSTQVTVTMRASGSGVTDLLEWTSGEESGGTQTSLNNDIVTPATISVTNATISNGKFTAVNTHSTSTKTYTITGTYEGTSATPKSITQVADEKIPSSGTYTTTVEAVSGGNGIWAGGGDALIRAYAVYVAGVVWKSDGAAVPGESTTVGYENAVTLHEASGSSGVTGITVFGIDSTNHTKTFRVSHRDMAKNETTDTIKVYAKNGNLDQSTVWSYNVTNAKTNEFLDATPWGNFTPNGQTRPVNRNYTVDISASDFASEAVAASFVDGSYQVLVYSGHHEHSDFILGTETRTCNYKYTSWYEGSSNYYPMTEERAAEREGEWEGRTDLMPTITSGDTSIATISTSDNHIVHFSANSGNANRSVLITAVNGDASASVRLYQSRFMSLTIDPNEALIFDSEASTLYFNVVSKNTKWRITKDGDWMTVSPTSGGSSNQQDTVRISVAVPANTLDVARIGEIDILQNDTPVLFDPIMLDTLQISSQPATSYIGFVNAGWISETSIMYQLSIKNELNYKAFSGTYINVVSTASASDNPAEGQLEASYEVGTVYADGHQTSLVDQGIISNIRRDYSRTYWVKVEQIDIASSYEQIEEAATGE